MFTYRWNIPGQREREVTLNVHSRRSWFGRKEVMLEGERVARRGWTEGVFCRFPHPDTGRRIELRLLPVAESTVWRPALFYDGRETPQAGGTPPPVLTPPPASIAVTAAIVYVMMLMCLISFLPINEILSSLYLNRDAARVAITVLPAETAGDALWIEPPRFASIAEGEAFEGRLVARGGTPPYHWSAGKRGWPRGIALDAESGRLHGVPQRRGDISGVVEVRDSYDRDDDGDGEIDVGDAKIAFSVYVRRGDAEQAGAVRIREPVIPTLRVGEPFEYRFVAEGGRPAPGDDKIVVEWAKGRKTSIPDGLRLDGKTGVLKGTPIAAGSTPLVVQAYDLSYTPMQDIKPWVIPFVTTGLCLLGYLAMRRATIVIFAILIIVQVAAHALGYWSMSEVALGLEAGVWLLGAAYWGRMN